ncbi:MAG: ATPase [Bacteroidales bacterium]|nr:ATPase [Bacteroidales bacterium]
MEQRLDNPFVVGRYVGGAYFCDREEETEMLVRQLRNGRDVALISPRRMGKSGLIHHLFARPEVQEKYNVFFIDIYSCSSLKEMIFLLGNAIYKQLKPRREIWKERFFQIISSFRVGLKMDAQSGLPVFDLGLGDISSPETTLDEIFRFLKESDTPSVLAIDEFQQILKFKEKNVEALLRTHIQQCPNVHWIFAGSQRHLIQGMFLSPNRPFYQSVITTTLHQIPIDKYCDFAIGLFENYGKTIDKEIIEKVYSRYQGYTWYIQMVLNEIFDITISGDVINIGVIDKAVNNILQMQSDNYREQMSLLTTTQKTLLQALAREGEVSDITSVDFVKRNSLSSPATVQSALRRLLSLDIVTRNESIYRITDFFLSQWLRQNI